MHRPWKGTSSVSLRDSILRENTYDQTNADGSVFKSGTMKLTVANNKATLKVNAVLNDGKDFKLNFTIPIETLE